MNIEQAKAEMKKWCDERGLKFGLDFDGEIFECTIIKIDAKPGEIFVWPKIGFSAYEAIECAKTAYLTHR